MRAFDSVTDVCVVSVWWKKCVGLKNARNIGEGLRHARNYGGGGSAQCGAGTDQGLSAEVVCPLCSHQHCMQEEIHDSNGINGT
jgi:hypothetical protein